MDNTSIKATCFFEIFGSNFKPYPHVPPRILRNCYPCQSQAVSAMNRQDNVLSDTQYIYHTRLWDRRLPCHLLLIFSQVFLRRIQCLQLHVLAEKAVLPRMEIAVKDMHICATDASKSDFNQNIRSSDYGSRYILPNYFSVLR